jgi:glyoxylase-like metal-dependent hydrolase (beta-lactamase superfamily II)
VSYQIVTIRPNVRHIGDAFHVYATLITGKKEAILLDTTNGLANLRRQVDAMTELPYRVIASHGHGDHTRGNYQFDRVLLHPADFELCRQWNRPQDRAAALENARGKGLVEEDFDQAAFLAGGTGCLEALDPHGFFDLGGLTVQVVPMPGHTPGSVGLLLREYRLLLTADACNPMMWMFLKGASSIPAWARMLEQVKTLPFDYFLPAHIPNLLPKARLDVMIETARRASLEQSVPMKGRPEVRVFSLGPVTGEEQLEDIDFTALYFNPAQLEENYRP